MKTWHLAFETALMRTMWCWSLTVSVSVSPPQGDTPKNRAEKAQDSELAAYLENRQHYQMIQREDQETAV